MGMDKWTDGQLKYRKMYHPTTIYILIPLNVMNNELMENKLIL